MKFSSKIVDFFGNLICNGFLGVFLENKQPQVVFEMSMSDLGKEGRIKQQLRIVMLDNTQNILSKESIAEKIKALQSKKTDVGFSYTADGLRIIVVPEDMTHYMSPGAPFGTPRG